MKIAFKCYNSCSNPENMPLSWPAEVMEVTDNINSLTGYQVMSKTEYDKYLKSHQNEYNVWLNNKRNEKTILEKQNMEGIQQRMAWGAEIIQRFRLYSLDLIADQSGLSFLSTVSSVASLLQLGILAESAMILQYLPAEPVMDSIYIPKYYDQYIDIPKDITVRQRFIKMIMEEGPTP
jgi:hypothetical protein